MERNSSVYVKRLFNIGRCIYTDLFINVDLLRNICDYVSVTDRVVKSNSS